jgi:hypothetical protein
MRQKLVFSIALAVVALLALAVPALAGGWAVVTLDTLPREVRAGQTLHLGFMVRQHGVEPNSQVSPILTATKRDATTVRVEARQEGPEGHFVVDVTLPSAGTWGWEIAPEPYAATVLAPLSVLPAAATVPAGQDGQPGPVTAAPRITLEALRLAGLLLLVVAALVALSSLRAGGRKPAAEA